MARCQYVHDLRQCPVAVGSPQTQPQRDQVIRIINRLTLSDVSITENASQPSPTRSPRSGANTPNSRKNAASLEGTEHDEPGTARNTHSILLEIESNSENLNSENSKSNAHTTKTSPQMDKSPSHSYTPSSSQSTNKSKQAGNLDTADTSHDKMNVESSNHKNVQIPYEPTKPSTSHNGQSPSISSSFIGALRSFRVTTKGTT